MTLGYVAGRLVLFENQSGMDGEQISFFFRRFPFGESWIEELIGDSKTLRVTRLLDDLSFSAIWEGYAYKVGNKKRAEMLWEKLSEAEKQQVFDALSPYAYYLMCHSNMEKLYLETFLNQRRYENDFREMNKKK